MARTPIFAALASLAACGGQSNCTIALSGAVSGTYACDSAVLGWVSSANQSNFTLIMPPSGNQVSAGMKFPGKPQETTYTELTPGAEGGVYFTSYTTAGSVRQWRATSDPVGKNTAGSITLKFTKILGLGVPVGYSVGAGTLDSVLQSQTGDGTTVNFHATFRAP